MIVAGTLTNKMAPALRKVRKYSRLLKNNSISSIFDVKCSKPKIVLNVNSDARLKINLLLRCSLLDNAIYFRTTIPRVRLLCKRRAFSLNGG